MGWLGKARVQCAATRVQTGGRNIAERKENRSFNPDTSSYPQQPGLSYGAGLGVHGSSLTCGTRTFEAVVRPKLRPQRGRHDTGVTASLQRWGRILRQFILAGVGALDLQLVEEERRRDDGRGQASGTVGDERVVAECGQVVA